MNYYILAIAVIVVVSAQNRISRRQTRQTVEENEKNCHGPNGACTIEANANELDTLNDLEPFEGDSGEFRLTKLLNIELGGKRRKLNSNLRNTVLSAVKTSLGDDSPEPTSTVVPNPPVENRSQEDHSHEEITKVLKELFSEVTALKKNISTISNRPTSECVVQSNVLEGKSFPVGLNYYRLCPAGSFNKDVNKNKYFPQSCREILENGTNVSGIYKIQPKQSEKPFAVLCDMETRGGGWTHIQKRYDGSVDFFLGWRDYKFGFGDLEGEFWLGLENIYKLTGFAASELLVEIVDRDDGKAYAQYAAFAIGSETEGYSLNVLKGFSGDAGDSLRYHLGSKFTTKDFDQDVDSRNCAVTYEGAWWYRGCHESNLNGKYRNVVLPSQYNYHGMHWKGFRGHDYCHAKCRMMVRPMG